METLVESRENANCGVPTGSWSISPEIVSSRSGRSKAMMPLRGPKQRFKSCNQHAENSCEEIEYCSRQKECLPSSLRSLGITVGLTFAFGVKEEVLALLCIRVRLQTNRLNQIESRTGYSKVRCLSKVQRSFIGHVRAEPAQAGSQSKKI